MKRKIWKVKEFDRQALALGKTYGISPVLAQVLLNRALAEDAWEAFLNPSLKYLHDPMLLPDMDKAVARIVRAVSQKEKILVAGDYDVDGVMSLAIFHEFLKGYPDSYSFYIPHRVDDGYGLNSEAIKEAKKQGAALIVAFDCGTNSLAEINLAKDLGIDIIVVDHHHPHDGLNNPFAFINPKRNDSRYPFPDLSSAGLSFKLLQSLKGQACLDALDLVSFSIVCDVVPLKGENRVLLKEGLKYLKTTLRPAITILSRAARINQKNIDVFHLGFILGPRINAAGRVAHAKDALEIFISNDIGKIENLAEKLNGYNKLRKDIEARMLQEAEAIIGANFNDDCAIVVCGQDWHQGVLGIVASRLVEKYYKPSFVFSHSGKVAKGSARSIRSVHLMQLLKSCAGDICSYGGHKKAAGIEILSRNLGFFGEKINDFLKNNLSSHDFVPALDIDCELEFSDINEKLVSDIERLKPYGEDNSNPLFVTRGVHKKVHPRRSDSSYSAWFTCGNTTLEGVIYDRNILALFDFGDIFDIAYHIERNNYHKTYRVVIKDIHLAQGNN